MSIRKPKSFWDKIRQKVAKGEPVFVIAPMANVTDYAFRTMFAKYGKPDVMWNEFVSADGLCSPGRERLLLDLKFSNKERPIVAQLFTGNPEKMREATVLIRELKFDGMDINMGCPDKSVEKQGSGAGHIKNPNLAMQVLQSAREGWIGKKLSKVEYDQMIADGSISNIPVSVKTRIGYNKEEIDNWIRLLLQQRLPALTVHLRTRKDMSDVPAHWELMPKIVALRDEIQSNIPKEERTLIIGNGDVNSLDEAHEKVKKYGCDGIMIGRGIFGKPWFFSAIPKSGGKTATSPECSSRDISCGDNEKAPEFRLKVMLEHTKLFEKTYCGKINAKNFAVMKKHFKAYVSGFDGAKELRVQLMETNSYKEVKKIVDTYLRQK
jgi:tRNA-dihydrouridine synthase